MPRGHGWTPWTYRLLGYPRIDWQREQDRHLTEVLDEAKAKAELGLERKGHPLKTRRRDG